MQSILKANIEQAQAPAGLALLPRILRILGSIAILAAGLTFLIQRWDGFDHVTRYYAFLGYTLLLTCAGFVCGLKIRDDKGARTFLAITAALAPVHFCQLGALLFSRYGDPFLIHHTNYPKYLLWSATSDFAALSTCAIGMALLIPIVFLSFSALLRKEAVKLTSVFLLANSLMLIPKRDELSMGILTLILFVFASRFDRLLSRLGSMIKTKEGLLVRIILWLPFVFLVGRTMLLYTVEVGALFRAVIFGCAAGFLFRYLASYLQTEDQRSVVQFASIPFAVFSWENLLSAFFEGGFAPTANIFYLRTLPVALLFVLLSFYSERGIRGMLRNCASIVAVLSVSFGMLRYPGVLATFLCISFSMIVTASGVVLQRKGYFLLGSIGILFGLLYHIRYAFNLASMSPWLSLAILGTLIVIGSSILERYNAEIKLQIGDFQKRFASWEV